MTRVLVLGVVILIVLAGIGGVASQAPAIVESAPAIPEIEVQAPEDDLMTILNGAVAVLNGHMLKHAGERLDPRDIIDEVNRRVKRGLDVQHFVSERLGKEIYLFASDVYKGGEQYYGGVINLIGGGSLTAFGRPLRHWTAILRRDGYAADPATPSAVKTALEYDLPVMGKN